MPSLSTRFNNWLKQVIQAPEKPAGAYISSEEDDRATTRPSAGDTKSRIAEGNALLDNGKLAEANECYAAALLSDPHNVDARVNLGYVFLVQERYLDAERELEQALRIDPDNADVNYMLGSIALERGEPELAASRFNRATVVRPDFEDAYGGLCRALFESNKLEEAKRAVTKGLALNSDSASFHCYLGNLLIIDRAFGEAIASFNKALSLVPNYPDALSGLGLALTGQGKLEEAIEKFEHALSINPKSAQIHYNLGLTLRAQGKLAAAIECYQRAYSIKPSMVGVSIELGRLHADQGRLDLAIESYQCALVHDPESELANHNLGLAFKAQGKVDDAIIYYKRALTINPDFVDAHINLGSALQAQGRLDEAMQCYKHAFSLKPDSPEAYNNLGTALMWQGKMEEASECFRNALAVKHECIEAHSNLLFTLNFRTECPPDEYLVEARRYGHTLTSLAKPYSHSKHIQHSVQRPLRVGLVSGDFRNHPVGYFLESILEHLNPDLLELVSYPTQPHEDELTGRIKGLFAEWKPLYGLTNEVAARQIHDDCIDVLIDLSGHTAHNRLPLFAWKPAPIQVTWLGYFATTGVAEIDFLIADRISLPAQHQERFTESAWYLPDTRLCFSVPQVKNALAITPLPAIQNGYVTFGSFQNLPKLNDEVLATWGRIFQGLPNARLRLQNTQIGVPSVRANLQKRLAAVGIRPEQLTMHGNAPREAYLAAHAGVDIILDTFPYPGGTTTCEALWMGVPTLTLAGDTMIARQGASLLACAGLNNWIAEGNEEYVALALQYAKDTARLAKLRFGLRDQVLASPLFDAPRFSRNLEKALFEMFHQKIGHA